MTLTDTLDHLLSVFLRPLRTWIEREVVAPLRAAYDAAMQTKEQYRDGVYLHLKERLEGTDEHPLAEGVPVRPLPEMQDLAHLQAAVELLDTRKVDTGSLTDGVPDGVSLVRLLCDSSITSQITEIIDTNHDWVIGRAVPSFPNLHNATLNMVGITAANALNNLGANGEVNMPYLQTITSGSSQYNDPMPIAARIVRAENLVTSDAIFSQKAYMAEEVYLPNLVSLNGRSFYDCTYSRGAQLRKLVVPKLVTFDTWGFLLDSNRPYTNSLIHLEIGSTANCNLGNWKPTNALRTDTTASDYIDLREDKDDSGEFINATNLEQFLANFRKYIILRVANRTGQTALTLTLSAAVYQNIYGLDSSNNADNNSWARTHTLSDLGLTAADLTEAETAAGITINTIYATWLDTYRSAINWNIGH